MVDQNSTPNQPTSGDKAEPSKGASQGLAAPAVVRAGEMMLIFALILIFAVCVFVVIHLYLRRQKRGRKKQGKTKKKAKKPGSPDPEMQKQEKEFAELVGTPLCEMGESEPRHEMEDMEVLERHTMVDLEHPSDNPVYSPAGTDLEAGTMYFGHMTSHMTVQPEPAMHAVYYARF